MSRVLAVTRELPYPPNAGDRVVTDGFLRALARRGHEVHVLSYERADDDPAADALGSFCESIVRVPAPESSLPPPLRKAIRTVRGRSDVMAMFDSAPLRTGVAGRVRALAPDVVLAQHPYMGQCFTDDAVEEALTSADADAVTSAHVVEYAAHRRHLEHADGRRTRLALAAEVPRLRREELAVYERSTRTLVLGRGDLAELDGRVSTPVRCQRVGLDLDRYEPAAETRPCDDVRATDGAGRAGTGGATSDDPGPLVFFGSYDWFPNADAARFLCEQVFPAVQARRPGAELRLAGRGADEEIAAYGDRDGVRFLGEVDDLAGLVKEASVVVAPLRVGGGTRIKVLESMAWGRPVVTTPAGAEGVPAAVGEALHVAEDAEAFAATTARLLSDPSERRRVAANARETAEQRYSIPAVAPELERHLGIA